MHAAGIKQNQHARTQLDERFADAFGQAVNVPSAYPEGPETGPLIWGAAVGCAPEEWHSRSGGRCVNIRRMLAIMAVLMVLVLQSGKESQTCKVVSGAFPRMHEQKQRQQFTVDVRKNNGRHSMTRGKSTSAPSRSLSVFVLSITLVLFRPVSIGCGMRGQQHEEGADHGDARLDVVFACP